jgi:hypothetical protein
MTEYAKPIDVTTSADLLRLAEQVRRSRIPVPLTRDDQVIAVVQPAPRRRAVKLPSERDLAATRSTFGALKGILDPKAMKRIYEARGSSRPPAKL